MKPFKIANIGCGYRKKVRLDYFNIPPGSWVTVTSIDHNSRIPDLDIIYDLDKYPYPLKDNFYDGIYISHSLEHLKDPFKAIAEFWRILKPDGQLVVRVPHCTSVSAHNLDHITKWNIGAFNCHINYNWYGAADAYPPFKLNSRRLFRFVPDAKPPQKLPFRLLGRVLDLLANQNPGFAERWWAYCVGGFDEIEFRLQAIKNGDD